MTDLAEIIRKHGLWLTQDPAGERANLRYADLRYANLRGADLSGADLSGAALWGASGNGSEVKALQCGTYPITYTATRMQIGCQGHAIADWWSFTDEEIAAMDTGALDWWRVWKPILQKIIGVSPAVQSGGV